MERADGETASSPEGLVFVSAEEGEARPSEGDDGTASSQDGVEAASGKGVFFVPGVLMKWRQFATPCGTVADNYSHLQRRLDLC